EVSPRIPAPTAAPTASTGTVDSCSYSTSWASGLDTVEPLFLRSLGWFVVVGGGEPHPGLPGGGVRTGWPSSRRPGGASTAREILWRRRCSSRTRRPPPRRGRRRRRCPAPLRTFPRPGRGRRCL